MSVEAPSGKGAGDENFPVGSWLVAARLRSHVAAFYAFGRAADDIADHPTLAPEDKIDRLDRFEAAILGVETGDAALGKAHRLRRSLEATGVGARHCTDLLAAFKQDATKHRYADWAELMDYCARSANPVGRFLLDLHGESPGGYPASDALCSALQVINHVQDVKRDYRALDRVYVPLEWLAAEGTDVGALDAPQASPAVRRVLDRCLDGVARLLVDAAPLPDGLRSPRLAMESAAILRLARRLVSLLGRRDPVAERVVLSRTVLAGYAGLGAAGALGRRVLGRRRTGRAPLPLGGSNT